MLATHAVRGENKQKPYASVHTHSVSVSVCACACIRMPGDKSYGIVGGSGGGGGDVHVYVLTQTHLRVCSVESAFRAVCIPKRVQ